MRDDRPVIEGSGFPFTFAIEGLPEEKCCIQFTTNFRGWGTVGLVTLDGRGRGGFVVSSNSDQLDQAKSLPWLNRSSLLPGVTFGLIPDCGPKAFYRVVALP